MKHTKFVASCDGVYLQRFSRAFVHSAFMHDNSVHIHVVNATDNDMKLLQALIVRYPLFTYSTQMINLSKLDIEAQRTVFATSRYNFVNHAVRNMPEVDRWFVMDIDSIFMKHYEPTDEGDVGLYFRDPVAHGARSQKEIEGMRVLAVCWIESEKYINRVCEGFVGQHYQWFLDQRVLYESYEALKNELTFVDISKSNVVDWEMTEDSVVWTGKGSRKYTNEVYVRKFMEMTDACFV